MRMIKLNKITSDRNRGEYTDEPGENQESAVQTTPCSVNVDAIRCFYPRRDNRPGTRITFTDGGGYAVSESYDEVVALTATH